MWLTDETEQTKKCANTSSLNIKMHYLIIKRLKFNCIYNFFTKFSFNSYFQKLVWGMRGKVTILYKKRLYIMAILLPWFLFKAFFLFKLELIINHINDTGIFFPSI